MNFARFNTDCRVRLRSRTSTSICLLDVLSLGAPVSRIDLRGETGTVALIAISRFTTAVPLRMRWVFAVASEALAMLPAPSLGVVFASARFSLAEITICRYHFTVVPSRYSLFSFEVKTCFAPFDLPSYRSRGIAILCITVRSMVHQSPFGFIVPTILVVWITFWLPSRHVLRMVLARDSGLHSASVQSPVST
jgi:hypothetical protein